MESIPFCTAMYHYVTTADRSISSIDAVNIGTHGMALQCYIVQTGTYHCMPYPGIADEIGLRTEVIIDGNILILESSNRSTPHVSLSMSMSGLLVVVQ